MPTEWLVNDILKCNRPAHHHRSNTRCDTNQILQDTNLALLDLCPQASYLRFNPRIDFTNLELLLRVLIAYPAYQRSAKAPNFECLTLLQVQIQSDSGLRPRDFLP